MKRFVSIVCALPLAICVVYVGAATALHHLDLTENDAYVRGGFDPAWLEKPGFSEGWLRIPGKIRGIRAIHIRELPLKGVPSRRFFSWRSHPAMEFTVAMPFELAEESVPAYGSLGLRIGAVGNNWALFLNGREAHREIFLDDSGQIAVSRCLRNVAVELDNRFLRPGRNVLVFRIIGDPTDPQTGFYSGRVLEIDRYVDSLEETRETFVLVFTFPYVFLGIGFVALFIRHSREREHLYLGLFCLCFFFYKLTTSAAVQDWVLDTEPVDRLEIALLFLLVPCMLAFLDTFLSSRVSVFSRWYTGCMVVFVLFCPFAPYAFLHDALRVFQATVVLPFLHVAKMFFLRFRGEKIKGTPWKQVLKSSEFAVFAGVMVCFLLGMVDICNSFFYVTGYQVSQYGFFLISIPMGWALVRRLTLAQRELLESERKIARSRRREIETLKKWDRLKDEFLANTSHELRTPVHGIAGLAEAALERLPSGRGQGVLRRYMKTILGSAKRLSILIDDILDYSRLKNEDLKLNPRPLDIYSLAEVVVELSRPLAEKKGLVLENRIGREAPAVFADENRTYQILQNLVGNAVKFTREGSVVLSAGEKDGSLAVRVTDTGPGIEPEHLETVFESFRQGDGSISREYGGTGLGLSISKRLVALQGGKIGVESRPGEGSTFFFTLPVADEKPNGEASGELMSKFSVALFEDLDEREGAPELGADTGSEPGEGGSKPRVLVVDDDPANLEIVRAHLADQYDVTAETDPEKALGIVRQGPVPDLVLLDIMMPHVSGLEVCREIRKDFSFDRLPIVFLTAKSQVADLARGFALGANDYIVKPFSRGELLARVKYHADFQRHVEVSSARLQALREFSGDLARFKDREQLAKALFALAADHIAAAGALAYHKDELLLRREHGETPEFLLKPPSPVPPVQRGRSVDVPSARRRRAFPTAPVHSGIPGRVSFPSLPAFRRGRVRPGRQGISWSASCGRSTW